LEGCRSGSSNLIGRQRQTRLRLPRHHRRRQHRNLAQIGQRPPSAGHGLVRKHAKSCWAISGSAVRAGTGPGGHRPVTAEPVDRAFDGVAVFVDHRVERWWPAALDPRERRPAVWFDGSGIVALIPLRRNDSRIFRVEYALSARTRSGRVLGLPPQTRMIEIAAITAVKANESWRCPADVTRATGRHRPSAARWIFVVTPPRLRPKPSRSGPVPPGRRIPCHSTRPPVLRAGRRASSSTVGASTSAGMSFGGACRAPAAW
jgi:hypothetical protein